MATPELNTFNFQEYILKCDRKNFQLKILRMNKSFMSHFSYEEMFVDIFFQYVE